MKRSLYLVFAICSIMACKKNAGAPSASYSFKTAVDSMGLQFGRQYTYKHFSDSTVYEEGFITLNADSSFIEILNSDTFYYHAGIVYTYDSLTTLVHLPSVGIPGNANGLKYIYNHTVLSSTLLYPGTTYLAWCCYKNDSIKGSVNFLPMAYFLRNFGPVFMGVDDGNIMIAPPETQTADGTIIYPRDRIIIER